MKDEENYNPDTELDSYSLDAGHKNTNLGDS